MEQHCNFIKIGPAKPKKMLILCFSHPRPPRTLDPENPQKNRAYSKTAWSYKFKIGSETRCLKGCLWVQWEGCVLRVVEDVTKKPSKMHNTQYFWRTASNCDFKYSSENHLMFEALLVGINKVCIKGGSGHKVGVL